jgi:hypothetical protein
MWHGSKSFPSWPFPSRRISNNLETFINKMSWISTVGAGCLRFSFFFLAKCVAYVEPDLEFGLWYYSATIACESMKIHTAFVRDL